MARKVIQMRDKYHSTTNIYPKQIEASLPKDVVPVAPEPETYTPTGEEPDAEYITINNVTYKVGGGGTEVVANPTLAGTEADLTGLQVGDTKYKVPSGGSFTQEQADWTETDNTKPSYIKNKPALKTVATSGSYNDLTDKPNLATVATSGSYNDLTDKPTIPTNVINYRELMVSSSPVSGAGEVYVPVNTMNNTNNYVEIQGYAYLNSALRRRFTMTIKQTPLTGDIEKPKVFIDYNGSNVPIIIEGYFYDFTTEGLCVRLTASVGNGSGSAYTVVVEHIKEIINY